MTTDNRALWELVYEWRRLSELLPTLSPVRITLCKNADELAAILERPVVVSDEDVERAIRASGDAIGGDYAGMRAALESMVRGKS